MDSLAPPRPRVGGAPLRLAAGRVVAECAELDPLARILCEEVRAATGASWVAARGAAGSGEVALRLDPGIGRGYRLRADDSVVVESSDLSGVAMGTVTLLQALIEGGVPAVPRLEVEDAPQCEFRGVMVDCARQPQSIETLRRVVCLCRFYKINYLQLHLTDDQAFAFPSERYPEIATAGRSYTRAELEELERFAAARGVVLVPELDVPGHGASMVRAMPELFGVGCGEHPPSLVHIGREAVYRALEELVGEMCSVFRSSPFVHVGGDEAVLAPLETDAEALAFCEKHGLPGVEDLFRHFLVRMHEIVARHGKRTLVWEGFRPSAVVEMPRDLVVVVWDTSWQRPAELLAAGHQIVNASWQPLYIVGPHGPNGTSRMWDPEEVYRWRASRWEHFESDRPSFGGLEVAPSDDLLGGLMCSWEQCESATLRDLRGRVAPFAERNWSPDADRGFADFARRQRVADRRLTRLVDGADRGTPGPRAESG